jgi:drug/metabolite transporter (DMT)-like permease
MPPKSTRAANRALLPGVPLALASAALFGATVPFAKSLLGGIDPWLLAGLFYLGAGGGLALVALARSRGRPGDAEAPLGGGWWWLAGAVAAGGVVGPVLLMAGLARTTASASALLLNLEGVFTALIAWVAFRENVDRRIAAGMAAIVAGAVVLGWRAAPTIDDLLGPGLVALACLAWAVDNNLTRKVALGDPVQVAMIKGLGAGTTNTALAFAAGAAWPAAGATALAGLVGFLGYGVSLALFVVALRHLGTARTAAYYSTAPFVGAALSVAVLGDPVGPAFAAGCALMAVGVWLHLTEQHEHEHLHEPVVHAHRHRHDAHHRHPHGPEDPRGEPHSHVHAHGTLVHSHPHFPDAHHRHRH